MYIYLFERNFLYLTYLSNLFLVFIDIVKLQIFILYI